jgi:hypothetical protein
MSNNQVALFVGGGAMALPDHLRGVEVDEQTKALAGGARGLRISIKGGVFRMFNNGDEIARSDDRAMNVVIVRSSPDTARQYYEGEYVDGEASAPTCWSTNGVAPEAEVKEKQSASCATCPQNVAGSGNNGESRACKFKRDLAVVLDGDIGGKVFKLSLPATSIFGKPENNVMPLQAYGKLLVQHNLPVNAVVTELRFDTSVTQPKLGFKAARYLTAEEYEVAKKQGETTEAIAATKTTSFQQDAGEPVPLDIPGKPAAGAAPTATTTVAAPAPSAVVAAPAVTAATAPKRTRAKANAAAPAVANAASNAATAASAESVGTASNSAATSAPSAAGAAQTPIKKMTDKAEFSYEEYLEAGWDDQALVDNGFMVIEQPKKPAPPPAPKKAAPPPPAAAAAQEPQVERRQHPVFVG